MHEKGEISRRKALKSGIALVAAGSAAGSAEASPAMPKKPGETKIVAVMGDYWHPAVSQEVHVRQIFSAKKEWRVMFVQAGRYFTPELIADADLVIAARYGGLDSLGWSGEGIIEARPQGDPMWTGEQVDAVIENVTRRGMGFLSIHCTLFCRSEKLEDFIGVEPILHQEIQPLVIQEINTEHPITAGIDSFYISLDEQFDCRLKEPEHTTVLFRSLAVHDKRNALSGWCLERGNGRIVGLLPGHYQWTYREPEYREIFWRAAHWAMKRDIPAYPAN